MPTLHTQSNLRQKQHINGQNSANQAHKIWHKNFLALPSNHISGNFFSHTLYSTFEVFTNA